MNNKLFSCDIFIDLKKSFVTVNHNILLNKLEHYGIRGVKTTVGSYLQSLAQTT